MSVSEPSSVLLGIIPVLFETSKLINDLAFPCTGMNAYFSKSLFTGFTESDNELTGGDL